jgi:NitT/TauT family transport system permease protein
MASLERSIELSAQPQLQAMGYVIQWLGRLAARSWILFLIAAVWEAAPRVHLVEPAFLPPLSEVLGTAWTLTRNGQMLSHVQASLARSLLGFALAILYGVPLGLVIGWYRRVADAINPIVEVARNTAPLALLPVFLLLLGIGESSKVALVTYACSWPILLNTIADVHGVDPLLIKSARTMDLSPFQLFRKVILPAALPTVFVGIRLAGSHSLLVLVAAEMIAPRPASDTSSSTRSTTSRSPACTPVSSPSP